MILFKNYSKPCLTRGLPFVIVCREKVAPEIYIA